MVGARGGGWERVDSELGASFRNDEDEDDTSKFLFFDSRPNETRESMARAEKAAGLRKALYSP